MGMESIFPANLESCELFGRGAFRFSWFLVSGVDLNNLGRTRENAPKVDQIETALEQMQRPSLLTDWPPSVIVEYPQSV